MPKENTHLHICGEIIEAMKDDETGGLLRTNLEAFRFGSIVIDTFFYSSSPEIAEISHRLHGRDGEMTNELTFDLLDLAKKDGSEKLLCVALGHISHCVLDMIFHPVIYYLVGNYYDDDPQKRRSAVYRHRLVETGLDLEVNRGLYLDEVFAVDDGFALDTLGIMAERYGADGKELVKAFRKQVRSNRCFRSEFWYRLIYMLDRLKIIDFGDVLPLFYGHLQKDMMRLPRVIAYRDIIDGRERQSELADLLCTVVDESVTRIGGAVAYFKGQIDRSAAERLIGGESLDTGRVGCSVREISHTK